MRIIVRTEGRNLWIPIPTRLVGGAIALLPEAVLREMRNHVAKPYQEFVTKEYLRTIYFELRSILDEYKGLEIIHVEAQDGTYVSVKL